MKRKRTSDDVKDRVVELRDAGQSWREIEEVLAGEGVRLSYNGARAAYFDRKSERERKGDGEGEQGEEGPRVVRVGGPVQLPELPENAPVAARLVYEDLRATRERMATLPHGVEAATEYASLARVAGQQQERLARLLPPPKPDASEDPVNVATRALVLHRIVSSIEAVKTRARRRGLRFPGDE